MAIILDKDSKIVVQGFTGSQGSFHAKQCMDYGSQIVAGVTPGRGGQTHLDRPVFNTVHDAVRNTARALPPRCSDAGIPCARRPRISRSAW